VNEDELDALMAQHGGKTGEVDFTGAPLHRALAPRRGTCVQWHCARAAPRRAAEFRQPRRRYLRGAVLAAGAGVTSGGGARAGSLCAHGAAGLARELPDRGAEAGQARPVAPAQGSQRLKVPPQDCWATGPRAPPLTLHPSIHPQRRRRPPPQPAGPAAAPGWLRSDPQSLDFPRTSPPRTVISFSHPGPCPTATSPLSPKLMSISLVLHPQPQPPTTLSPRLMSKEKQKKLRDAFREFDLDGCTPAVPAPPPRGAAREPGQTCGTGVVKLVVLAWSNLWYSRVRALAALSALAALRRFSG